ncbi:MAG: hypothetical protein P8R37_12685, partial [Opitutae bacterium]|nr:hypothetical protein [Opitutae bacterium]
SLFFRGIGLNTDLYFGKASGAIRTLFLSVDAFSVVVAVKAWSMEGNAPSLPPMFTRSCNRRTAMTEHCRPHIAELPPNTSQVIS